MRNVQLDPAVDEAPERPGRHRRRARRPQGEPLAYLLLVLALALAVVLPGWGQPSVDTSPRLYFQPGRALTGAFSTWSSAPSLGQQSYDAGIAPAAATTSSSSRQSRVLSQTEPVTERMAQTAAATGAMPVS